VLGARLRYSASLGHRVAFGRRLPRFRLLRGSAGRRFLLPPLRIRSRALGRAAAAAAGVPDCGTAAA
jgi:hypothetical protein